MLNPLLVQYIGASCAQCGKEYKTAADLMDTKFGRVPDVVCSGCWNDYAISKAMTWLGVVEMVWNHLHNVEDGCYVAVLNEDEATQLRNAVRPATSSMEV